MLRANTASILSSETLKINQRSVEKKQVNNFNSPDSNSDIALASRNRLSISPLFCFQFMSERKYFQRTCHRTSIATSCAAIISIKLCNCFQIRTVQKVLREIAQTNGKTCWKVSARIHFHVACVGRNYLSSSSSIIASKSWESNLRHDKEFKLAIRQVWAATGN